MVALIVVGEPRFRVVGEVVVCVRGGAFTIVWVAETRVRVQLTSTYWGKHVRFPG